MESAGRLSADGNRNLLRATCRGSGSTLRPLVRRPELDQDVLDGAAEFTLAATDIFNSFGLEETIDGDGFVSIYQNFYQTQTVTASIKYTF